MSLGIRASSVSFATLVVLGMAAAPSAHASHAVAGNCKHTHVDPAQSKSFSHCNTRGSGPLEGQACTVSGAAGYCDDIARGCICRTDKIDDQLALLNSVHQALETAL